LERLFDVLAKFFGGRYLKKEQASKTEVPVIRLTPAMKVANLSKVAVLREDVTTSVLPLMPAQYGEQVAIAARGLGIDIHTFIVRRAGDLAAAFLGMKKNDDRAVVVMSPAFMFVHRQAVLDLAGRAPDRRHL
jgi:hypothetical protein